MRTMTLAQMAHLLNCQGFFPSLSVQGYCVDSRLAKPGELFIALKGDQTDGHQYLREVQKKGVFAAIVSKNYQEQIEGLLLLKVEDPLHALQEIAKTVLAHSSTRIVAITGSLGKTSAKEFTKVLLETTYQVGASLGNQNSQVGLPLTLLNHTTGKEDILVLEMGMTAPGQLARLVQIAPPEVAVLTTVALVHAEGFESIEDIAWAKGEIFSHSHTRLGILHHETPQFEAICRIGQSHKLSFSTTSFEADYRLDPVNPLLLQVPLEGKNILLDTLPIPGKHNIHNLLAAIAVARHFNVTWENIKAALAHLTLPERRLQFVRHQGILFLNDSYNASELSMKAALEILPPPDHLGRKIAVLGSLLELGKFSQGCHERVGEFALKHVDQVYCLGEECRPIYDIWQKAGRPVHLFHQRSDLIACLKKELTPPDVVLLKGSRAKELWKVLEEL